MLFNSLEFLALYLPVTLVGFFLIGRRDRLAAAWWLALASVAFYAGWSWRYVPLLLGSIAFNFAAGQQIVRYRLAGRERAASIALALAIAADLALLSYYKYADFLIANWNAVTGASQPLLGILLPLGISFFTFTQIAFLVDSRRGIATEPRFSHYLLFVTYFPHLIAGPVLHHKEMMPQFEEPSTYRFSWHHFAVGTAIFLIGLFKKTVLADGIAEHVAPTFSAAHQGGSIHLLQAWGATMAYSMQLYFDFSGYSDMAIGLSRMFGIRLPLNFDSPYKARNISDFWRRWHMTLSRFLRDYLYISMGGNQRGKARRYLNLIITMFLGGLWHGAAWTFAIWGLLHGAYLVVHHAFQALRARLALPRGPAWLASAASVALTYAAVLVGWVFFRAESLDAALAIVAGMAGANGVVLPEALALRIPGLGELAASIGIGTELGGGREFVVLWAKLFLLHLIVFAMPNTQELMRRFAPALDFVARPRLPRLAVALTTRWAVLLALLGALGLLAMTRRSEFLYYQF